MTQRTTVATIPIDLAGLVSRSLALNDAQWARGEITHDVWSLTYIALANYATAHGVAAGTFGLMPPVDPEYAAYLAGERPDPRD